MNEQANVEEFRRLEAEIAESETDIEAKRWRQAELAATAAAEGMSRVEYGKAVGKGASTISRFVRAWDRWGALPRAARPRFADAVATVEAGSAEIVTRAEQTQRQKERQVPTRHEDKVEMATKLLADPKVTKAVVKDVLAKPSPSQRLIRQAVHLDDAEGRAKDRERAEQRRKDEALPLPAYMNTMVLKMNEWSLGLAGLVDDLDELPDGRGRELVLDAICNLIAQAQRWRDRLERRPDLYVIDGQLSVGDIAP